LSAVVQDCAQGTFSRHAVVNDLVGTLASLPLLVPFEMWRAHVGRHGSAPSLLERLALSRAWLLASALEWLYGNLDVGTAWAKGSRRRVLVSLAAQWCVLFLVARTVGWTALLVYWVAPWCCYLVWRSVFLHVACRVPFTDTELRLSVTISLPRFPRWLEFLTNDVGAVLTASRLFSRRLVPNVLVRAAYRYLAQHADTVFDLDEALEEEREKEHLVEEEHECERLRATLDFGRPLQQLPLISRQEFKTQGKLKKWVLCDGVVFDVAAFHSSHPGGEAILAPYFGLDISNAFNGDIYNHSNAARNLSRTFMIARVAEQE